MDDQPPIPSPNPLGADAPETDYVGLAIGAMAFSIVLGTGWNSAVTWLVRTLQAGQTVEPPKSMGDPSVIVLLGGTFLGLVAAATSTWILLRPVKSPYRQGMLGMVSAFGTMALSLITQPVDIHFGRTGLVVLVALAVLGCTLIGRRLSRLAP
jgi:hypothetical protein